MIIVARTIPAETTSVRVLFDFDLWDFRYDPIAAIHFPAAGLNTDLMRSAWRAKAENFVEKNALATSMK